VPQYKAVSVVDLNADRAIVVVGIKRIVPSAIAIDAIELHGWSDRLYYRR
jgi:hypothetical protein